MSTSHLENSKPRQESAGQRVLALLKTQGPQTAISLGTALGSSDEAARQQLVKLAAAGLVESISRAKGVGRPSQYWRLTAVGHAGFPDGHSALTTQLLTNIANELGEGAVDKLLRARQKQTTSEYLRRFAELGAETLEEKVTALGGIRSAEGYMAEVKRHEEGFLLIENHCPIAAAACTCTGFCGVELNVFRAVLGSEVIVERIEHILAGERRCVYRISAI